MATSAGTTSFYLEQGEELAAEGKRDLFPEVMVPGGWGGPPTSRGLIRQRGLMCHGGGNPVTSSPKAMVQRDPHLFGAPDALGIK